jgi:CheY-like chemotaxis protein
VPDGGVELSVRDNGRGIPAEHRERVFGVSRVWRALALPAADRRGGPVRALKVLLIAGDGEQAMQRLVRSRPGPPQLVLLDLKMPRMDGLGCCAASAPTRASSGCRWWC